MKVAIIHPDLGIGGAERLIVDVAVGLQRLNHSVDIYTSFHDRKHCFTETVDGTLNVVTLGNTFIPRNIFQRFHLPCAILRQFHLILQLWFARSTFDVILVDQLSPGIPFIRILLKSRVVFYCHFPDKLLANSSAAEVDNDGNLTTVSSRNLIKGMYRAPLDWLEEITTGQADQIIANSKFTAKVFSSCFPSIKEIPEVIYPALNIDSYEALPIDSQSTPSIDAIRSPKPTFLSLNRFESKKNLELAIESFALLKEKGLRLVLAGGCDKRLPSQSSVLQRLKTMCQNLSLTYSVLEGNVISDDCSNKSSQSDVLFLLNYTNDQRSHLLHADSTQLLLYTPTNEHFGIGPLEAMISSLPVLCTRSGGPRESVVEGETGYLRPPDPYIWCEVMKKILHMAKESREELGSNGRNRVLRLFSADHMAYEFARVLQTQSEKGPVKTRVVYLIMTSFCIIFIATIVKKLSS